MLPGMRSPAPMSSIATHEGDPFVDPATIRAPLTASRRSRPALVPGAWVLAGAVLLVARHPDLFTRPTLWAEDGNLLMHDALVDRAVRNVSHPYNGTFIVFQRVVAQLVTAVP